jgi:predicted ATP-grasp superfamily ATP-dependent carboligase
MKILVTDGSYSHSLSITRTLGKRGHEVYVLDSKKPSLCGVSNYCKGEILSPDLADKKKFIRFLIPLLKKAKFDILIPVGSRSVRVISEHKKVIENYTLLVILDFEKIKNVFNKIFVYALADKIDIPYPKTVTPKDQNEINKISEKFDYPVVIKAQEDTGGHLVEYVNRKSELAKRYRDFCIKYKQKELPMIQQYIKGDGYGFFAIYQDGKPKRIFMHHRIRESPPKGGASSCAESFFDSVLKDYGIKLLNHLEWHGVAMVEFKKDEQGYHLMEINPKFWGSLDLAIASGVDFPNALCRMAQGVELTYSEDFIVGLRFQWPFSDDLVHIALRPLSIPSYVKDFLSPRVKMNVLISDLKPNMVELKNSLIYLARNAKRYLSYSHKVLF